MPTERPAEQLQGESSGDSTQSKLRARFSRLRPRRTDESEKKKQLQDYLAWVNNYLKRRPGAHLISDLRSGLQDGVALVNLVEVVANAEIPFVERVPTSHAARKANIQKAISFLTSDGVRLQGDPVKDIMDGSVKGVLRVILAIAEKYNPRSVRRISSEIQNTPLQETRPAASSFRTGSPDRLMPHDLSSSLPNTSPLAASSMTVTNMPTAGVSLSQVTPASSVPMPGLGLSQGVAGGPMFLSQPAPVVDSIYSTPVDSLPQNVVQRISSHMPSHRLIGQRNIKPTGPRPRAPSPKPQLPPMKETEDEGMVSLQLQHELGVVLKQLSVFKSELLGLHSLLIENGDTDVTDGKDMNAFASSELLSKEKEIVALHQEMLLLKEQLEKDHSERQTLHGMVQERNQFITTMKSEIYRKEYRNDTERVDLQTQILQKDKIIGTLEAELKGLKEDVDVKEKARIDAEEASTQHKLQLQHELDCVRAELSRAAAAEESLHAKLSSKDKKLAVLEERLAEGEGRSRRVNSALVTEEMDRIREQLGALRTAITPGDHQHDLLDMLEKSISALMAKIGDRARSSSPPKRPRRHHEQRERRRQERRERMGSLSKEEATSTESTKVFYYMTGDRSETPYVTTVMRKMSEVRLKDFKAVFDRHGSYRFYFKTQDPDCGVVREEVVDDDRVLPCWNGKIIVWVSEKGHQHK